MRKILAFMITLVGISLWGGYATPDGSFVFESELGLEERILGKWKWKVENKTPLSPTQVVLSTIEGTTSYDLNTTFEAKVIFSLVEGKNNMLLASYKVVGTQDWKIEYKDTLDDKTINILIEEIKSIKITPFQDNRESIVLKYPHLSEFLKDLDRSVDASLFVGKKTKSEIIKLEDELLITKNNGVETKQTLLKKY
jgi:hypothetical protein